MRKIKKGDKVIVTAGKDKGKTGVITHLLSKGEKFIVEGVNLIKKHMKPNPNAGQKGGIIEKEAAIHCSNVALVNPVTGKCDKVAIKILEDGRKVRIFKSNKEVIDI
ncbi:MAG: 50S ribosomal protein L24 [Gammaproteobacteria bacterium]